MDPINQYEPLTPEEFDAKVAQVLTEAIDPHALVEYNGQQYEIMDLPRSDLREQHGYGHSDYFVYNRERLTRPDGEAWSYTVQTCLVASADDKGVWVSEGHLACCGCGVDCA